MLTFCCSFIFVRCPRVGKFLLYDYEPVMQGHPYFTDETTCAGPTAAVPYSPALPNIPRPRLPCTSRDLPSWLLQSTPQLANGGRKDFVELPAWFRIHPSPAS